MLYSKAKDFWRSLILMTNCYSMYVGFLDQNINKTKGNSPQMFYRQGALCVVGSYKYSFCVHFHLVFLIFIVYTSCDSKTSIYWMAILWQYQWHWHWETFFVLHTCNFYLVWSTTKYNLSCDSKFSLTSLLTAKLICDLSTI